MKSHSRKVFLCVVAPLLLLIASVNIVAQQKVFPSITYRLSMTRPVSHLFEVAIEVELPSDFNGESLAFQMPKVVSRTLRNLRLCQERAGGARCLRNLSAEGSMQDGAAHSNTYRRSNVECANSRYVVADVFLQSLRQRSFRHLFSTRRTAREL